MNSLARRLSPGLSIGLLLPVVLCVPSLLLYLGLASSMALGACVAALVVLGLHLAVRHATPDARWATRLSIAAIIVLLVATIVLHLLVAAVLRPVDPTRAGLSLIPLALMLTAGYGLGQLLCSARARAVDAAVYSSLWLLSALSLAAVAGLVPPLSDSFFKPVFPYTEPSHFALAFVPLLMYGSVRLRGRARLGLLAIGLAIGWALESLTLMAGWLLIATVCLRKTASLALLGLVALAATQLDTSYYLDRLDFGGEDQNLSTLVYVQGWQLMVESLRLSSGWGLGFQQLGVRGTGVDASDLIYAVLGENSNLLDGGFALSKIVSEFGAFGPLLILAYLSIAWRAAKGLRLTSQGAQLPHQPAVVLARCVVVSFGIELLVRGAGYFSGSTLLLVAALTILSIRNGAERTSRAVARPPGSTRPRGDLRVPGLPTISTGPRSQ
jgi:hypothetical protein